MSDERSPARLEHSLAESLVTMQALTNMDGLSYEQYFKKVDEIMNTLKQHWSLDQKVKALKVAIQMAKLLADTSQMKLYSKKYKMITESLDEFGRLVYMRIHSLASGANNLDVVGQEVREEDTPLFKSKLLSSAPIAETRNTESSPHIKARELAQDTCRNWFLKIASIRELVPRYYIELAILRTCDILSNSAVTAQCSIEEQFFAQTFRRLTKVAWGFGDPIVALHARVYLCKVAEKLIAWNTEHREEILFDIISTNLRSGAILIYNLDTLSILKNIKTQNVQIGTYFDLISTPLQSILSLITTRYYIYSDEQDRFVKGAKRRLESVLVDLLNEVRKDKCSLLSRSLILHSAFKALPADTIADHSQELLELTELMYQNWLCLPNKNIDDLGDHRCLLTPTVYFVLISFLTALDASDTFETNNDAQLKDSIMTLSDKVAEDLLQYELQRNVDKTINPHYVRCLKALLSYAAHHLSQDQVDRLLARFARRIKDNRQYASHYQTIIDIIKIVFTNKTTLDEFKYALASKSFGQLFEFLRRDDDKLDASKWILETMRSNIKLNYHRDESMVGYSISDKATIKALVKLFATINDSLSILTALDDFEHLSRLVIFFLERISVPDYSEQLEFLSRCRNYVGNLNLALEHLTRRVLCLAIEYRKVEKKRSSRQNYLNGCLAYGFVTIPALNKPSTRLELLIQGGRLALNYTSLSLADYYVKQAVLELADQVNNDHTYNNNIVNNNKQSDLNWQTKMVADQHRNRRPSVQPTLNRQLVDQAGSLLEMILEFQHHIDLKHKLQLSSLIRNSFNECPDLMNSLRFLNCIDDNDDGTCASYDHACETATS